jgi:outer membrane protein TolC
MKRDISLIVLKTIFTFWMTNSSVAAEEPKELILKELIAEALKNNPEIQSAQEVWEASEAKIPYAQTLPDPKVGLGFEKIPEGSLNLGEAKMRMYQASQMFPYPGKLRLKGEIASKQAEIAEENFHSKVLKIKALVKAAYYELYFVHKAIEITEENKEIIKKFSKIAEIKYSVGKAPQQHVLKAQVELSKLIDKLITLKQLKETAEARLNTLLNRPTHTPLGRPAEFRIHEFNYSLDELNKLTIQHLPELKAARAAIKKAEFAHSLAKKQYYPDFMITTKQMDSKMGEDSWTIMASINLPLYYKKKQDYLIKEAQAKVEAAKADYQAKKNMALFKVKDLLVKLQTAKRSINLYKTSILPQAEQSLKASEIGYETERVDFLNLLDSQRMLLNFRLGYYRALVDFEKHLANLEQVVGIELTKEE